MIPDRELGRFTLTFQEASAAAREGSVLCGYILLNDGLCAARNGSKPWTDELIGIWRAGLRQYRREFPAACYPDGV